MSEGCVPSNLLPQSSPGTDALRQLSLKEGGGPSQSVYSTSPLSDCNVFPFFLFTFVVMTAITGLLAEVDQQLSREGDTQTQYSTDLKVLN